MRKPKQRGAAIDAERLLEWERRFKYYRAPPGEQEIMAWLNRFSAEDRDVGARVLDCVEVISEAAIQEGYKRALETIDGWHKREADREGRWVFTGFGRPGESGLSMLRVFREANGLTARIHDSLFRHTTEIPSLKLSAEDTIVVVDDFAGTGKQICSRWPTLQELIASDARCYLVLTAATTIAVKRIKDETGVEVIVKLEISKSENVFADTAHRFDENEKTALLKYCTRVDAQHPRGYGECGLLYVLSHKTPNNSIPILHVNHDSWVGLFPRNLQKA